MSKTKIPVIVALAVALGCFYFFDLGRFITLGFVQSQIMALQELRETNFPLAAVLYFSAYVAITAFSIPGAVIITLLGGAVFGLFWGTLLASFASSIGATAAFLIARVLLRDWVQSRFGESLKPINEGIAKGRRVLPLQSANGPLVSVFSGECGNGSDANSRAIVLFHQPAGYVDGYGSLRQRRRGTGPDQFTVRLGECACSCLTGSAWCSFLWSEERS